MKLTNLLKNEHMKLYQQRTSIITLVITYVATVLTAIIQSLDLSWNASTYWEITSNTLHSFIQIFMIISIITATNMISSEYTAGTMKLLLIRPISRASILLSKYITLLLFVLTGILGSIPLAVIMTGALYGLEGWERMDNMLLFIKPLAIKLFVFPFYTAAAFTVTILTRHLALSLLITILFSVLTVNYIPLIPGIGPYSSFLIWGMFYTVLLFTGWREFNHQET